MVNCYMICKNCVYSWQVALVANLQDNCLPVSFLPCEAMLSAVYAVVVCLCVCLSVTLWYCIKTARRRIMQITPHDSPMTLVF